MTPPRFQFTTDGPEWGATWLVAGIGAGFIFIRNFDTQNSFVAAIALFSLGLCGASPFFAIGSFVGVPKLGLVAGLVAGGMLVALLLTGTLGGVWQD